MWPFNKIASFCQNKKSAILLDIRKRLLQIPYEEQLGRLVMQESGKNSYAGPGFCVSSLETSVGSFCSIAQNVTLGTTQHPTDFLSTHPFTYFPLMKLNEAQRQVFWQYVTPVVVENDVWIGKNVTVLDGVKIHNGAIVGTNAVVTKDVPPYAIVVGIPAKIIRYRFENNVIKQLLELEWWNMDDKLLCDLPYGDVDACISLLKQRKDGLSA